MAKITLPGLIDPHVHLRDPGQTEKEDFYTGTCAALAGGYTIVLDMPNNKVPISTFDRLGEKIKIAKGKAVCDIGFYFGSLGDNLDEFKKIPPPVFDPEGSDPEWAGGQVFGIKLYLNQTTGNFLINESALSRVFSAIPLRLLILVHAEGDTLENVLKVLREHKKNTHICHISLASELKQIINAKNEGLPITCGVTPHHLFLTENDVKILGPFGKMRPPLRSKKDVDFLWKNLKYIDCIESDHAPHTIEEKKSNNPPNGVPGLETTLPLLLTAVSENRLTIEDVLRLCYENPKKIFKIQTDKNTKTEIDLSKLYIIENRYLHTKCGWSPFNNWKVKGKVERVFIRGTKVFENGKVLVQPGFGKVINPL